MRLDTVLKTRMVRATGVLLLISAGRLGAQIVDPTNMKVGCDASDSVCTAGSVSLVTLSTLPTFDVFNTGSTGLAVGTTGEAYLAILVPGTGGTLGGTLTVNGTGVEAGVDYTSGSFYTPLAEGDTTGTNPEMFGAFKSMAAQAGVDASSGFTVYDVSLGPYAADGSTTIEVTLGGVTSLPLGTIFSPFLENGADGATESAVVNGTAHSEALTIVPEPRYTSALLAFGLLAGIVLARRYRSA